MLCRSVDDHQLFEYLRVMKNIRLREVKTTEELKEKDQVDANLIPSKSCFTTLKRKNKMKAIWSVISGHSFGNLNGASPVWKVVRKFLSSLDYYFINLMERLVVNYYYFSSMYENILYYFFGIFCFLRVLKSIN